MTVIIDQRKALLPRQADFPVLLEASLHTLEFCQRLDDGSVGHAYFVGNGDCRQGIANIVHTGKIQGDVKPSGRAVDTHDSGKSHLIAMVMDIDGAYLCIVGQSIGRHGFGNIRHDLTNMGIIYTQNRHAIKRQMLHEFDECLFKLIEVVSISFHMIRINICHDGQYRLQIQE